MDGVYFLSRVPREDSLKVKLTKGIKILRQKLKDNVLTQFVEENDFTSVITAKDPRFAKKLFKNLSRGEQITSEEIIKRIVDLVKDTDLTKLKVIFSIFDTNDDGLLSWDEVADLLQICLTENGLELTESELARLIDNFMACVDTDNSNTIDFTEFKSVLNDYPGVIEFVCRSFERWILCQPNVRRNCSEKSSFWEAKYLKNNPTSVITLAIYIVINVALFVWRLSVFIVKGEAIAVGFARGAGMCLNFNCSLIMVFILRRTITKLRMLGLADYLPLDKNIKYHKYGGFIILFFATIHTCAHIINFARISNKRSIPLTKLLFGINSELFSYFFGAASVTGWICLLALTTIIISAAPCFRKSGRFEIFYYFHLFYIIFWATLLAHGPMFFAWLAAPGIIFTIERILVIARMLGAPGHTYVARARTLPSNATQLVIRRPSNFNYHPGDYVFIQIPAIAQWEWHPFTISSAPEMPDFIFLHIRAAGQWTKQLRKLVASESKNGVEISKPCERTSDVSIEMTPTSSKKLSDDSGTEISMTTPLSTKTSKPTSKCYPHEITISDRSQLISRLHAICDIKSNEKCCIVEFTRPIGRNCDDDESQFYEKGREKMKKIDETSFSNRSTDTGIFETFPTNKSEVCSFGSLIKSSLEMQVRLDGPYGSPSSHIFNTEHAVLIAAGIGVTPFASILQSIMFRYIQARQTCPKCTHSWTEAIPANVMKLRKVDFIWLNRDHRCLEWFVHLLAQLEMTQASIDSKNRFLDIHIYVTSAIDGVDIRALALQLALGLMHEKGERDLITGLKTRTKPGRPDWETIFEETQKNSRGKVSVFFCGPQALSKTLHAHCNNYGFKFRKENF